MKQPLLLLLTCSLTGMAWAAPLSPPVDLPWFCKQLVHTTDLWNGGPDGTTGMGAYLPDFSGFYNVDLEQDWFPKHTRQTTAVAQARGIYMNIEAYRATLHPRFKTAAEQGAKFLLDHFYDPTYGGFYWSTNREGFPTDRTKQGYGNVFALFTLAQLYSVTQQDRYLQAALKQFDVLEKHFIDPSAPGAVFPGFTFDFGEVQGFHNIDTFTHYFEALLALHDVTEGDIQKRVARRITEAGHRLIAGLYRNEEGRTDRGYVAYNYTPTWEPRQDPYTRGTQWTVARQASTGHNIELAYLLSRAVERGFDPAWLDTADKLRRFVEVHAMVPATGGMHYEVTDYDGSPLPGNPDNNNYVWWANAEAARAFLHFAVVGKANTYPAFLAQQTFIQNHFVDPVHGGWFQNVDADSLKVFHTDKGNVWTVNYHETMLAAEVLRLSQKFPETVGTVNCK